MKFSHIKKIAALAALFIWLVSPSGALAQAVEATLPPFDETVAPYDAANPSSLAADQLYAESAILINRDTGRVLFEKNADAVMSPASTTKIMTTLVALDYYGDYLYEVVTIPPEAAEIPEDSSKVPVQVGEEMTFIDLLYGFMLKSGNDAANAIAVIVAGSVDAFVAMMNDKAEELGLNNTHFENAHGYTADGHYTTARDLAKITQAAMESSTFRKIVSSGQYTLSASNVRDELVLQNSNMLVVVGSKFRYRGATGVKTGNTSAAGQCLVSSATRDGINLLAVVMKSTVKFQDAKWQDSARLLDYGFSKYVTYSFDDLYAMAPIVVPVSGAAADDSGVLELKALVNRAGSYSTTVYADDLPVAQADFGSHIAVEYTRDFTAPIEEGAIIGKLTFTPDEGDVITAVLVASRPVEAAPVINPGFKLDLSLLNGLPESTRYILLICAAFLVIFVFTLIVAKIGAARRRRKRRRRR